jgi:hypothetical protein
MGESAAGVKDVDARALASTLEILEGEVGVNRLLAVKWEPK